MDWEEFLRNWSKEILAFDNHEEWPYSYIDFTPEQIETGWVGNKAATEPEIEQLETRLGINLPPSYKQFLRVSNGWRWTTPGMQKVYAIDEIKWFKEENQELIDDWCIGLHNYGEVPDEDYFIYGEERLLYREERFLGFRVEYLRTALAVAWGDDSQFYLLNPHIIFPDGEWEAWIWTHDGPIRYRSFEELLLDEYRYFLDIRELP